MMREKPAEKVQPLHPTAFTGFVALPAATNAGILKKSRTANCVWADAAAATDAYVGDMLTFTLPVELTLGSAGSFAAAAPRVAGPAVRVAARAREHVLALAPRKSRRRGRKRR